jgi:hypothetical protein
MGQSSTNIVYTILDFILVVLLQRPLHIPKLQLANQPRVKPNHQQVQIAPIFLTQVENALQVMVLDILLPIVQIARLFHLLRKTWKMMLRMNQLMKSPRKT